MEDQEARPELQEFVHLADRVAGLSLRAHRFLGGGSAGRAVGDREQRDRLSRHLCQDGGAALEGGRAHGAPGNAADARCTCLGQLEGRCGMVAPGAQVDAGSGAMDDSHSQNVLEIPETALGLWREELDIAEMGDVMTGLRHH